MVEIKKKPRKEDNLKKVISRFAVKRDNEEISASGWTRILYIYYIRVY